MAEGILYSSHTPCSVLAHGASCSTSSPRALFGVRINRYPSVISLLLTTLLVTLNFTNGVASAQVFSEEAVTRGVDFFVLPDAYGRGLAAVDLDNDGDDDLVLLGGLNTDIGVYENDGTGNFLDRSASTNIPPAPEASGVSSADYDGDGDVDLYITLNNAANLLLQNQGNFVFVDRSVEAGVADPGPGHGCAWGDYDGDGWLDLYVGNRTVTTVPIRNRLYRNNGDGSFTDLALTLGVRGGDVPTFQPSFFDYDRDGDADLYLCNDKGNGCDDWQNLLYRNDDGVFVDVTAATNTEACLSCMGTAIGDLDNNGFPDFYCTNIPFGNALFFGNGNSFNENAIGAGVGSFDTGWGTLFLDFDNDSDLDLFHCVSNSADRLYENDGDGNFIDVAASLGIVGTTFSYCVTTSDLDLDGDVDFLVSSHLSPVSIYINNSNNSNSWIGVSLRGSSPNSQGIGANVVVELGAKSLTQEALAGSAGFKSDTSRLLHFGLGAATTVPEIRVVWPSGRISTTGSVSANQVIEIWEIDPIPFKRGDTDGDGVRGLSDVTLLLNYIFSGGEAPRCAASADVDDNDRVHFADALVLVAHLYTTTMPILPEPFQACALDPTVGVTPCSQGQSCP